MRKERIRNLEKARAEKTKANLDFKLEIPHIDEVIKENKQLRESLDGKLTELKESIVPGEPTDITPIVSKIDELVDRQNQDIEVLLSRLIKAVKAFEPHINVAPAKVKTVIKPDIYDTYKPTDAETKSAQQYYGYVDKHGSWFIMRLYKAKDSHNYRYAKGDSNYLGAWRKRKSHQYKRFHEVGF